MCEKRPSDKKYFLRYADIQQLKGLKNARCFYTKWTFNYAFDW